MANRFFNRSKRNSSPRLRPSPYGKPALKQRLRYRWARLIDFMRMDNTLHLLWGFNSPWEFWFCAIPAFWMSIYAMVVHKASWLFYALGWFFGWLITFILFDIVVSTIKSKNNPDQ